MQSFTFKCPTEIVFGKGAEEQVPEKLKAYGATKILIVYGGGSVVRSGADGGGAGVHEYRRREAESARRAGARGRAAGA